jgi:hypothetical protein
MINDREQQVARVVFVLQHSTYDFISGMQHPAAALHYQFLEFLIPYYPMDAE